MREKGEIWGNGAGSQIRTDDLRITNALLYQLSYSGESGLRLKPRVKPCT